MHAAKNTLSADFVEICKHLQRNERQYVSDIVDQPANGLAIDKSFGLSGHDGAYYFFINTIFGDNLCSKAYYGNFLRINFHLNKSLHSRNPYKLSNLALGDAVLIKDNREIVFYPNSGLHVCGLNILLDPDVLYDSYGLIHDNIDPNLRLSLTSRRNVPAATKVGLPTRCFSYIETLERCIVNGLLQDRLLRAKAEEIICEIVYCLNNYTSHSKKARARLTRSQIVTQNIQAVARFYEQNMHNSPSIDVVSRSFGLNKNILTDGFKEIYGMTPGMYARKVALEWAREQMKTGVYRVQEIAFLSGYKNASAFSRAYAAFFGASPTNDVEGLDV